MENGGTELQTYCGALPACKWARNSDRSPQNVCAHLLNKNMQQRHHPILKTKVKSSCITCHIRIKFCKSNSFSALMILYSLTQTISASEFFWFWKRSYVPICLYIAEKCYPCSLTAFSFPWTLKLLLIFFSGNFFLQDSLAVNPKSKQIYMASLLILPISLTVAIPPLFLAVCYQTWMSGTSLVLTKLCSLCPTTLGAPTQAIVLLPSTH